MEISIIKLAGREPVSCLLVVSGAELRGTAVPSGSGFLGGRDERPTKAFAVAEKAQASAYASVATIADLQQQKRAKAECGGGNAIATAQHHMWAFRGPDPWKEPS